MVQLIIIILCQFEPSTYTIILSNYNEELCIINAKNGHIFCKTKFWLSSEVRIAVKGQNCGSGGAGIDGNTNCKFARELDLLIWDFKFKAICGKISLGERNKPKSAQFEIKWTNTPCTALIAQNSTFIKCYNLHRSDEILLLNNKSNICTVFRSINQHNLYKPFADLLQGIEGEEIVGLSMKPILSSEKNCFDISHEIWSIAVLVRIGQEIHESSTGAVARAGRRQLTCSGAGGSGNSWGLMNFRNLHMSLVIEGIKNSRRFVLKWDLTYEALFEGDKKQVFINVQPYSLERFKKLADTCRCNTFKITSEQGELILKSMQDDQVNDKLTYNFFKRNCVSWCKQKLKVIGLKVPRNQRRWYQIIIHHPNILVPLRP